MMENNYNKVQKALSYISSDICRDDWLRVLIALKSEFPEYESKTLAENWSQESNKFNQKDFNDTWRSIQAEGAIKIATLFHMAKEKGYCRNQLIQAHKKADEIYNSAPPASLQPSFKYVTDKKIVLPNTVKIDTYQNKSNLIVPIFGTQDSLKDKLQSLLFIHESGDKRFLSGAKRKGGFFNFTGSIRQNIIFTEGLATAATISEHYSPDSTVIVAFSADNLQNIVTFFFENHPNCSFQIAADNDSKNSKNIGLSKALEAAKLINCEIIIPKFSTTEKGSDWNDRYILNSEKALRQNHLEIFQNSIYSVSDAENFLVNQRLDFKKPAYKEDCRNSDIKCSLEDFAINNELDSLMKEHINQSYILDGIAVNGQITTIYAPPNHGKTLLVIWLLIDAIKKNLVRPENVFYINADDNFAGMLEKAKIADQYKFKMLVPGQINLTEQKVINHIHSELNTGSLKGKVFIFDTLKKFNDCMDKKSSTEFMKLMRKMTQQQATVILLNHVNKNRNEKSGELVMAGTSDVNDDSDCSFILERVKTPFGQYTYTFVNKKRRGYVNEKQTFIEPPLDQDVKYTDRLNAISILDRQMNERFEKIAEQDKLIQEFKTEILYIRDALIQNSTPIQSDIISNRPPSLGKHRIQKTLEKLTGVLWEVITLPERKGAKAYSLIENSYDFIKEQYK